MRYFWHRARRVTERAARLPVELLPLSADSPDFMRVEALGRGLREDVTYHGCHDPFDELKQRVAHFANQVNAHPVEIASRLRSSCISTPVKMNSGFQLKDLV
jgi:hypothetical protein